MLEHALAMALLGAESAVNLGWLWAGALVLGGFVAGAVNAIAGGGSFITMPLLMATGLGAGAAIGTGGIAVLVQSFTAVWRYARAGRIVWREAAQVGALVAAGAAVGAWWSAGTPHATLKAALGVMTLIAGGLVLLDVKRVLGERVGALQNPALLWPALFLVGMYGGAMQAGVGYLFFAVLTLLAGKTLVDANGLKLVGVLAYAPIVLTIFALSGRVHVVPGLLLAVGQAAGAWVGAGLALERGAGLVRALLAIVLVIAAVRLLF